MRTGDKWPWVMLNEQLSADRAQWEIRGWRDGCCLRPALTGKAQLAVGQYGQEGLLTLDPPTHSFTEAIYGQRAVSLHSCPCLLFIAYARSFIEVHFNTGNQRKWDAIFVPVLFITLFFRFPVPPMAHKQNKHGDWLLLS